MVDLTTIAETTTPAVTDIGYTVINPSTTKDPKKVTWGNIANLFRTIVETLTGKTINLADNTLTGTTAQFDTDL